MCNLFKWLKGLMTTKPTSDQITHEGALLSDVLAAITAPVLTVQAIEDTLGYIPVNPAAAVLTGTPTVPTAAPGTASGQAASTAFVAAAVAGVSSGGGGSVAGVSSFNARTGNVTLNSADVTTALGFTPASSTAPAGVSTFNGRAGTVTLTGSDVVTALETAANAAPVSIDTTAPNALASSVYLNRTANYTGGNVGHVNSALFVDTTVSAGATSFEWGVTSRVNNSASGGENVGVYGQGNKLSTGPTWGGCFEVCDTATWGGTNGTSGGTVGAEVDVWCNGPDEFEQRIGVDVVVGNAQLMRSDPPVAGPKGYAYDGVRIGAQGNNNTLGAFHYAVKIMSAEQAGIVNQASGVRGIYHLGSYTVGIDLSQSNNSDSALRIKAKDWIALDASSQYKLRYDSDTGRLQFYGNGANRGYINLTSGADTDLAGGAGGSYVDLSTNQTVGGVKSFSNGIVLPSAGVTLGVGIGTYGSMSNWGASQARAFTDSTTLNIDSLCTSGTLRSFMSTTPTNEQVEVALRPLYCIVSALVKALQDRKVI